VLKNKKIKYSNKWFSLEESSVIDD